MGKNRDLDDAAMARVERHEHTRRKIRDQQNARIRKRRAREGKRLDDGGLTDERLAHGDEFTVEPGEDAGVHLPRNRTQTILDRYYNRKLLRQREYDAGCELYRLWRVAGGPELRAAGYEPHIPGTGDMTPAQVGAREKLNRIWRAVGQLLSPILFHVCLCDLPASAWTSKAYGEPRAGIVVLRLALKTLANHWHV